MLGGTLVLYYTDDFKGPNFFSNLVLLYFIWVIFQNLVPADPTLACRQSESK